MKFTFGSKNLMQALFIVLFGFLLFNLAFLMLAAILNGLSLLTQVQGQPNALGFSIYMLVLLVLSWVIFGSKLSLLLKAAYLTMPVMSVLVIIGILMFGQPLWLVFGLEGFLIGGLLYFLKFKKQPWQYTFAVLYCTVIGLIISIFDIQI